MNCKEVKFSGHAIQRMFERKIDKQSVMKVVNSGQIIDEYPDDKPYPSFLLLGFVNKLALHVVLGVNDAIQECYVITVYLPDTKIWQLGFKKRKK
ncbi:DUF4258 domain-containing protein [Candidatus Magnetomoraceae bacterium gMMP-15]